MEEWQNIALIGGSILAGTVIPGPSFVVVTQAAMTDRRCGVFAALGVAFTSAMFAVLALAGLLTILDQVPALYSSLKIAGGLYLIYLGWCMWRAPVADQNSLQEVRRLSGSTSFRLGIITQASNPKAALVYASTFAAFLPETTAAPLYIMVVLVVVAVSTGWYGLVAFAASMPSVSDRYHRSKKAVDRFSGALLSTLGIGIVVKGVDSG